MAEPDGVECVRHVWQIRKVNHNANYISNVGYVNYVGYVGEPFYAYPKEPLMENKSWLNVSEAAAYLQVSRETIYSLMDRGLLPYSEVKGVRGRRIRAEDLEALLHSGTEKQKSEHKRKKK